MKYELSKSLKRGKNGITDFTPIIALVIVLTIVITFFIIFFNVRNNKCLELESSIMDEAYKYAELNGLPVVNGKSVTVNLGDLSEIKFKDKIVWGTVKITKVNNDYVKTFNISNASYCNTSKRYKMSKPTSKYPKGKSLVDVTTKYNFVDVSYNYTPWSDFIESSKINTKEDKTYKVLLPLDLKKLPKVSEAANILSWEVEEKEYYKYRDKKWKWYINQNSEYSGFSSEQPSGYANKDRKTEIQAEQTEWSTNYPEEKSYRKISTQTGYKFYYEDENGNKVYYNEGKYVPRINDDELREKYNKKEKTTVLMYSYVDSMWKWYNGVERIYSGYTSLPNYQYKYKDEDLMIYTNWSRFSTTSYLTNENMAYREQITDMHKRYRAYFSLESNLKLDNYVTLEELESKAGRTIEEMLNDKYVKVLTKYEYTYGK